MISTPLRRWYPRSLRFGFLLFVGCILLNAGLALSLTPVLPVQAATLTVCASGCDATTIAAAIAGANAGDTITVTDATHTEAGISVTKDLTIQGQVAASTTVDGGGSGPVFTVQSGVTATIQNMTISNGYAIGNGGGGITNSGTLTLANSTLSGNSATYSGGGIANSGTLTLTDSTLSDNSAGVFFQVGNGGGIYNSGTLTITNSTLSGNWASGGFRDGNGGGIYNASSGTLTITNSTLSGNWASGFCIILCGGNGGGIANSGTLTLANSTLSGNSATSYSGGIGNSYGGTVTITNSTLSGNSAGWGGGGIHNFGTVNVKSAIVANSPGGDCINSSATYTAAGANLDTDGTCAALDSHFTQVTPAALNLGPLALNAPGTTATHALLPGSVAIDAAGDCNDYSGAPVTTDQRGIARPQGFACDIGAYEENDYGPDLTGSWLDLAQTCRRTKAGQRCWLTGNVEVYNQGDQQAPIFSFLQFYLSADSTFDPATDTFLKEMAVRDLNPGTSQHRRLSVSLPQGQSASGMFVLAVIDAGNLVAESDETNNLPVFGPLP